MEKETLKEYDAFIRLVYEMLEAQDLYFSVSKKSRADYLAYKRIRDEVYKKTSEYILKHKRSYCELNIITEGKASCAFQCDKCLEMQKSNSNGQV